MMFLTETDRPFTFSLEAESLGESYNDRKGATACKLLTVQYLSLTF